MKIGLKLELSAATRKRNFYRGYGDPGSGWYEVSHGDTKAPFETLASDLKLLENTATDVDSDAVTASLIEAFIGNGVASLYCGPADVNVLESIMKELETPKIRY